MVASVTPFARVDHPPGATVFKPIRLQIEGRFYFRAVRIELPNKRRNRPPFGATDPLVEIENIDRLDFPPNKSRDRIAKKVNIHVASNFHATQ